MEAKLCRATAPVAESKNLAGDAPALQLLENEKKQARATNGRIEPRMTRMARIEEGINAFLSYPRYPRNPRLTKAVWQQFAGADFFSSEFKMWVGVDYEVSAYVQPLGIALPNIR